MYSKDDIKAFLGEDRLHEFTMTDGPLGLIALTSRSRLWLLADETRDWTSQVHGALQYQYGYAKTANTRSPFWLNGCAARFGTGFCIVLDAYLVPTMFDLAAYFLSHPSVLPHIGESQKELSKPITVENWPGVRIKTIGDRRPEELREWWPKCAFRQQLASELAALMLDLLWLHEFYHVVRGHVDFLEFAQVKPTFFSVLKWLRKSDARATRALFERATHSEDERLPLLRLEFDADRVAMFETIKNAAFHPQTFALLSENRVLPTLELQDRLQLVVIGSFLIQTFWQLLDVVLRRSAVLDSHPPTHVRALACGIYARDAVDHALSKEANGQWVLRAAVNTWRQFCETTGREEFDPVKSWKFRDNFQITQFWLNSNLEMEALFLPFQYCLQGHTLNLPPINMNATWG